MRSRAMLHILVLGALCSGANAAGDLSATVSEQRSTQDNKESVRRELTMGNMKITYTQLVSSSQSGRQSVESFNDHLDFPAGDGGYQWGCSKWLNVYAKPAGKRTEFCVNARDAQRGVYVLESGRRAVVDAIWPFDPGPQLNEAMMGTRIIRVPEDDRWFFLEIYLDPEADGSLSRITFDAYPYATTGPEDRRRWVSTLAGDHELANSATELDSAQEWGLVLHNKYANETGGCLLLYDPNEVSLCLVKGTGPVVTEVTPKPGSKRIHFAVGYFWDQRYQEAVDELRAEADSVLASLRETDWEARIDWAELGSGWKTRKEAYLKRMDEALPSGEMRAEFDKLADPLLAKGDSYAQQLAAIATGRVVVRASSRDIVAGVSDVDSALRGIQTRLYEAGIERLTCTQ